MTTRGVVYVATGKEYIEEALVSAASVRNQMPNLLVTLFCDQEVICPAVNDVVKIEVDPSFPGCAGKIPYIAASPYDQTLFLDSDTYVCGGLAELFDLLDAFDIAAAHSPTHAIYRVDTAPDSFPEFNTGVILYRSSPPVHALFSSWAAIFARHLRRLARDDIQWLRPADRRFHTLNDQGAFREALFQSRLRVATLSPVYNCRFSLPGCVDGAVKIVHGRGVDLSKVAQAINAITSRRGFEERRGALRLKCYPEANSNTYSFENIRYTLRRRGFHWTAAAAVRRLSEAVRPLFRNRPR
jgi:hypothetical protein